MRPITSPPRSQPAGDVRARGPRGVEPWTPCDREPEASGPDRTTSRRRSRRRPRRQPQHPLFRGFSPPSVRRIRSCPALDRDGVAPHEPSSVVLEPVRNDFDFSHADSQHVHTVFPSFCLSAPARCRCPAMDDGDIAMVPMVRPHFGRARDEAPMQMPLRTKSTPNSRNRSRSAPLPGMVASDPPSGGGANAWCVTRIRTSASNVSWKMRARSEVDDPRCVR